MNITLKSSAAGTVFAPRANTSASSRTTIASTTHRADRSRRARVSENIENAVYAHLQAMRALGHAFVNTSDVARALGLPQSAVDRTIAKLKKRGIKVT